MEALLINEKLLYVQYHLPGGVSQELKVVAGRQPAVLGWVRRLFAARSVEYIHIYKHATHRSSPLADLVSMVLKVTATHNAAHRVYLICLNK